MRNLKKRRKDNRLILLYKGLKGKARISTGDLIRKTRRCRNQHTMAFQIPSASVGEYKRSFSSDHQGLECPLLCPPLNCQMIACRSSHLL